MPSCFPILLLSGSISIIPCLFIFLSIFLIPIVRVLFALVCNVALLRKEFRPGTDILAVPRAGIHTAVAPEEPPVYRNGISLLEQFHSVIAPLLTEGVAVCNMSLQTAGLLLFNLPLPGLLLFNLPLPGLLFNLPLLNLLLFNLPLPGLLLFNLLLDMPLFNCEI